MAIVVNLQNVMSKRKIGLLELSKQVGITPANMSILKNNRARAVRFSTLERVCEVLDCQPGDILEYRKTESEDKDAEA
ncbi:MAG: helix-turn-helix transcriptional regulator [Clostridiales bacterium]|nr:helix-turn-helix transcriptional regulator [Clostridiales bacterium]